MARSRVKKVAARSPENAVVDHWWIADTLTFWLDFGSESKSSRRTACIQKCGKGQSSPVNIVKFYAAAERPLALMFLRDVSYQPIIYKQCDLWLFYLSNTHTHTLALISWSTLVTDWPWATRQRAVWLRLPQLSQTGRRVIFSEQFPTSQLPLYLAVTSFS